jgi:uncharacterized protein (UPF0147 family)
MSEESTQPAIEALEELRSDTTVPKNIKQKIGEIIDSLKDGKELSMKINRALNELDEISDNNNIQPYTRTQIWNVVSILESLQSS